MSDREAAIRESSAGWFLREEVDWLLAELDRVRDLEKWAEELRKEAVAELAAAREEVDRLDGIAVTLSGKLAESREREQTLREAIDAYQASHIEKFGEPSVFFTSRLNATGGQE